VASVFPRREGFTRRARRPLISPVLMVANLCTGTTACGSTIEERCSSLVASADVALMSPVPTHSGRWTPLRHGRYVRSSVCDPRCAGGKCGRQWAAVITSAGHGACPRRNPRPSPTRITVSAADVRKAGSSSMRLQTFTPARVAQEKVVHESPMCVYCWQRSTKVEQRTRDRSRDLMREGERARDVLRTGPRPACQPRFVRHPPVALLRGPAVNTDGEIRRAAAVTSGQSVPARASDQNYRTVPTRS
jgi:hypothetical protein